MRPARKIQDHEVRAAADVDPECRVRIRLTTSADRHLEDLTRRYAAFHPGDAIRELHLSKKGWRVDHRVVRSQTEFRAMPEHARNVRRHPEERIRARTHDDRDVRIGAPFEVR